MVEKCCRAMMHAIFERKIYRRNRHVENKENSRHTHLVFIVLYWAHGLKSFRPNHAWFYLFIYLFGSNLFLHFTIKSTVNKFIQTFSFLEKITCLNTRISLLKTHMYIQFIFIIWEKNSIMFQAYTWKKTTKRIPFDYERSIGK